MNELYKQMEQQVILFTSLRVVLVIVITFIVKSLVDAIFDSKIKEKIVNNKYQSKTNTVISIFKNLINAVIYFLAITYILNIFNINTASILAVAGVGGMALAFAAKSIVEDLITGAFILVEDQFNIGDLIQVNGITGTVIFMGIRLTKLRDLEGREIIIPNSNIGTVINYSINDMRAAVSVNISSKKSIEYIKEVINNALQITKDLTDDYTQEPVIMGVEEFTDYTYKIFIVGYVKNGRQWDVQRLMRSTIISEFQKNQIAFSSIDIDNYGSKDV